MLSGLLIYCTINLVLFVLVAYAVNRDAKKEDGEESKELVAEFGSLYSNSPVLTLVIICFFLLPSILHTLFTKN